MVCAVLTLYTLSWCWCKCPDIGISSIDWTQLSRFHLKTETESSLRNVFLNVNRTVFLGKNRTTDNVQKHTFWTSAPQSQVTNLKILFAELIFRNKPRRHAPRRILLTAHNGLIVSSALYSRQKCRINQQSKSGLNTCSWWIRLLEFRLGIKMIGSVRRAYRTRPKICGDNHQAMGRLVFSR
jgi:hypothetical protein